MNEYEKLIGKRIEDMSYDEFNEYWFLKYGEEKPKDHSDQTLICRTTGQLPETITFEGRDLMELITMIDSVLQIDLPANRLPMLLKRIKKILLKYGISWTGREIE